MRFELDVAQRFRVYCEVVSRKGILGEARQQEQSRENKGESLYRNMIPRKSVRERGEAHLVLVHFALLHSTHTMFFTN